MPESSDPALPNIVDLDLPREIFSKADLQGGKESISRLGFQHGEERLVFENFIDEERLGRRTAASRYFDHLLTTQPERTVDVFMNDRQTIHLPTEPDGQRCIFTSLAGCTAISVSLFDETGKGGLSLGHYWPIERNAGSLIAAEAALTRKQLGHDVSGIAVISFPGRREGLMTTGERADVAAIKRELRQHLPGVRLKIVSIPYFTDNSTVGSVAEVVDGNYVVHHSVDPRAGIQHRPFEDPAIEVERFLEERRRLHPQLAALDSTTDNYRDGFGSEHPTSLFVEERLPTEPVSMKQFVVSLLGSLTTAPPSQITDDELIDIEPIEVNIDEEVPGQIDPAFPSSPTADPSGLDL